MESKILMATGYAATAILQKNQREMSIASLHQKTHNAPQPDIAVSEQAYYIHHSGNINMK
jgi:hypothetical protein